MLECCCMVIAHRTQAPVIIQIIYFVSKQLSMPCSRPCVVCHCVRSAQRRRVVDVFKCKFNCTLCSYTASDCISNEMLIFVSELNVSIRHLVLGGYSLDRMSSEMRHSAVVIMVNLVFCVRSMLRSWPNTRHIHTHSHNSHFTSYKPTLDKQKSCQKPWYIIIVHVTLWVAIAMPTVTVALC